MKRGIATSLAVLLAASASSSVNIGNSALAVQYSSPIRVAESSTVFDDLNTRRREFTPEQVDQLRRQESRVSARNIYDLPANGYEFVRVFLSLDLIRF